jgi:hypothetical protein
VLVPQNLETGNRPILNKALRIRQDESTEKSSYVSSLTRKRDIKYTDKTPRETSIIEDSVHMKLLKSRLDHQLSALSGVFKRLKLENEEVR